MNDQCAQEVKLSKWTKFRLRHNLFIPRHRWYIYLPFYGTFYRIFMKFLHKFNKHWSSEHPLSKGFYYCGWCGKYEDRRPEDIRIIDRLKGNEHRWVGEDAQQSSTYLVGTGGGTGYNPGMPGTGGGGTP